MNTTEGSAQPSLAGALAFRFALGQPLRRPFSGPAMLDFYDIVVLTPSS